MPIDKFSLYPSSRKLPLQQMENITENHNQSKMQRYDRDPELDNVQRMGGFGVLSSDKKKFIKRKHWRKI